ncbi:EscU/YscU/HrcU family type III secretion system export apparatus switch protein [Paenibacillus sp. J5C_2022]|uniref:EscU/YscU/HrcU family type III secretion system export apparatus switch protein n=1 Tax=Paenibacillus sp. J5C2022 TaxID=2977129 RepID=UPI0021CF8BA8|nr:EscU/YscU/HrcU family type III secretion system export apparatus switch protein [Paenibacillus sp. J5C2022]MCU6707085.1 EscU/YscU/HrcU family type III secretion system export apparatus switch protein [Paenibacillus sp. J5C2022]
MTKEQEGSEQSARPAIRKAVALKYEPGEKTVPVLVAKGSGELADRIVEKARESGVPLQEDASLVEVLSKLDVDQEIPPELYTLVAEILSFVYRSDRRAREMQHEL